MGALDEYGSIREAIAARRYHNPLPWSRDSKSLTWKDYHDEQRRLDELFRQELLEDLGLSGAVGDAVWEKAWEEGHSGGLGDVASAAYELADIVEKAVRAERERVLNWAARQLSATEGLPPAVCGTVRILLAELERFVKEPR